MKLTGAESVLVSYDLTEVSVLRRQRPSKLDKTVGTISSSRKTCGVEAVGAWPAYSLAWVTCSTEVRRRPAL